MKNKKLFFLIILIILSIIIFFIFFHTKMAKNLKMGNNITSQEIVNQILNISSYETKIEVEVNSNKNQNKYVIKQQFESPNVEKQEVLEPENIAGIKILKEGNQLKLENTKLNLSTIFENYEYLSENVLDLSCFIEDYKQSSESYWEEENGQIVMRVTKGEENKKLVVDKGTCKPVNMEVKWTNKKNSVYILYKEVKVSS